jgi:hypothetical protein
MESVTIWVINIVGHLLMWATLVGMGILLVRLAKDASSTEEQVLRALSAGLGFLIYFGSRALDLAVPDIIVRAMGILSPVAAGFVLILPLGAGFLAGQVLQRWFSDPADESRQRLAILVSTILVLFLGEVYLVAAAASPPLGRAVSQHLLPNVAFVIGAGLHLIRPRESRSGW